MVDTNPGVYTIAITPFNDDMSLDEVGFRQHIRRQADAGVGVYVAGAGSGEGFTLTDDETLRIMEIAVDEAATEIPIRAMGSEPRTADEMIKFVKLAEAAGVDAVQIYTLEPGHGYIPKPHEVEAYMDDVLSQTSIPAILSAHMSVGYFPSQDVIERMLAKYDNISGLVISSMFEMKYLFEAIQKWGDRLEIISGGGLHGLINFAFGGAGFGCTEGNIAPRLVKELADGHHEGDMDKAFAAQRRLMQLGLNTWKHGTVSSIKAALDVSGLPGGPPRRPRIAVDEEGRAEIKQLMDELNIAETENFDAYR